MLTEREQVYTARLREHCQRIAQRQKTANINARMENDLLAEAYLHLEMRQRTRHEAQAREPGVK